MTWMKLRQRMMTLLQEEAELEEIVKDGRYGCAFSG